MNELKKQSKIEMIITNYLLEKKIRPNLLGFHYLREGIKLSIDNDGIMPRITKVLYPSIALKYSTTSSKVERAIRHAITDCKRQKNKTIWFTNAEFIANAVIDIYG